MPRVLNVAEKPSVAREVSAILGQGRAIKRPSKSKYNAIWEFPSTFAGQSHSMRFTSVLGHIEALDFPQSHNSWHHTDPLTLLDTRTPVVRSTPPNMADVAEMLRVEARQCDWLILWLDCDREGENIAFEVMRICYAVNRNMNVHRAKFSSIIPSAIHSAINRLERPNKAWSDAVDARQEIDLRIGAAFTRFQTLLLRPRLPQPADDKKVVSYGPCQFPTLGFVVDRYRERLRFVPEQYWSVLFDYSNTENETATFHFTSGRVFDRAMSVLLVEMMAEINTVTVMSVQRAQRTRTRPLPLTTVQMQKRLSSSARLSSARSMEIAEKLYQRGLISYPRTETERFAVNADLQALVTMLSAGGGEYGFYANRLLQGQFQWPREGKNDDKAHPPIHPTKLDSSLAGDERVVYDFVVRHFLACCSRDATGESTTVTVRLGDYFTFTAKGLTITAKNYLDIYRFDRWFGHFIPAFRQGQSFAPQRLRLEDGKTQPPPLLSESDLISLMDRNGIGTDATIAQHIQTIIERGYSIVFNNVFVPTSLGLGLVEGYDALSLSLSSPALRAHMEQELKLIGEGMKDKQSVIESIMADMQAVFVSVRQQKELLCAGVEHEMAGLPPIERVKQHSLENMVDEEHQQPPADNANAGNASNSSTNSRSVGNNRGPSASNAAGSNVRRYSSVIGPPNAQWRDDQLPPPSSPPPSSPPAGQRGGKKGNSKPRKPRKKKGDRDNETASSAMTDTVPVSIAPRSNACFHCGSDAHFASECPNRSSAGAGAARGRGAGARSSRGDSKCYRCGGQGHWANACPNPPNR